MRWELFELDVPGRRLHGADGEVHVEPQVFDVLAYLVAHRERVIEKAELLDQVWGDQFVSESALTTRIKQARRAIGDDGRTQRFIRNVHGRGYQFVGEIQDESSAVSHRETPEASPRERTPVALALSIALDDEFPFVGRQDEVQAMKDFLIGTESAQVLIGGAPGVGKSRLAIHVLEDMASRGAVVCAGRCEEHVTSALQPVRDAVAQIAVAHPAEFPGWAHGLEGPLASLIPSLGLPFDPDASAVDGYAGLDALLAIFDRVAHDYPVVALIDDLQWSDQPTRAFLSQVQRRSGNHTISTIASFRSSATDLRPAPRQCIGEQTRLRNTTRIDLDHLDARAASSLVREVLGDPSTDDSADPDVIESLLARTGGHPLFLTESLRDHQLGVHASGSIADLVTGRIERLADNVKRLVEAGAIIGPEFTFALAVDAAELEPSEALDAIDQAVDAELLHETASASRFRFSHQLVPEAIRHGMSRAARAKIHHRCAVALDDGGGNEAEIAMHTLGSIPLVQTEVALEVGLTAADNAMSEKQFDRAIRLLELCVDVETQVRQRGEILVTLGDALVASGRAILAVPYYDEAIEIARRNGWTDLLVAAALGHYGRSPYRKPRDRSTLAILHEALEALGDEPSTARARVMAKIAAFSAFGGSLQERDQMTLDALEMASDASVVDRMELLESRAIVFTCPAGVDRLEEVDAELGSLREEIDAYFADAAAPETALLMRGDGEGLRRVARFDEARSRVQPISEWRDLVLRSTLAALAGSFDDARELCDEAGRIGEPYWGESCFVLQAFGQLFVSALSGQWDHSVPLLAMLETASDSALFKTTHAWALAGAGHLEQARGVASSIRHDSFRWMGEHIVGGNALVSAVEVALLLEDDELLDVAARHLEPYSELVLGVPWACSLAAADPLSRVARRRGDDEAAESYAETARRLYTSLDAPALLARLD